MKKVFATLLALVLVLAACTSAMAGTITINNGVVGQTYTAYNIFDVTKAADATTDGYAYTASDAIKELIAEAGTNAGQGLIFTKNTDGSWNVSEGDNFTAQALASFLAGKVSNFPEEIQVGSVTISDTANTIDGVGAGYYFVTSSLGSLCMLNTAAESVTITEKNEAPTLAKQVQEDSDKTWGNAATACKGQSVNFKLTVTIPNNNSENGLGNGVKANFVITDTLPINMEYVSDSVTIPDWEKDTDYTITVLGRDLTITLMQAKLASLTEPATIEITYTAKMGKNAVAGVAETNEAVLTYGTYTTTKVTATVTTYSAEVFKYTGTDTALAGAEFKLYKKVTVDGVEKKLYYKNADSIVSWVESIDDATFYVTTDENGAKVKFDGLGKGKYYLVETKTPAGYNPLTSDKEFEITDSNVIGETLKVLNSTGSELPSTGGIGTTIFYVVGGLLMAGALVLLITKKKVSAK